MFATGLQVFHMDQPTYQAFTLVQNGIKFVPKTAKYANLFPYWNVVDLPVGPSGKHPYSFSGGFAIGVPRKKQRSSGDTAAAWEFTKFMALVGQLTFERYAGNIPAVMSMAHDPSLQTQQHWSSFVAALKYGHAGDADPYDPLFPDDVLVTGSPAAQNLILNGTSPKDALDKAQAQALANMKRNGGP
jgi:ABC-type glycerol-3-phosphate transport system substrate-binding protein